MSSENECAQRVVDALLPPDARLTVLEAGCGSVSHLRIPPDARVVGIDISPRQLERNTRLVEKILGDVGSHPLPPDRFDLVVCWDVLEHLPFPQRALCNLFRATKAGGVIVLALPNLFSIKGLITKLTPYGAHLWFYRYLIGDLRPRHESDQFPTYLRLAATPARIVRFAREAGLVTRHFRLYEGPVQSHLRSRYRWADAVFAVAGAFARALTLNRFDPNLTDCIIVLQKPHSAPDRKSR